MGIFDQLFKKNKQKPTIEEEEAKATKEAKRWFHMGYVRVEMSLAEEGIKYLDKAIKNDPQCADALNGKGMALSWVGKYEEAIKCYDNALEINSNNDFILQCKRRTLEKLGRYEVSQKSSTGLTAEEILKIPEGTMVKLINGNEIQITPGIRLIAKYEYRLTHLLGLVDRESERNFIKSISDEELIERATFVPSTINNIVQFAKLEMCMRTFMWEQSKVVKKYLRKNDENINRYEFSKDANHVPATLLACKSCKNGGILRA
jgi:tetratricopeptide (TPR) repeat protein